MARPHTSIEQYRAQNATIIADRQSGMTQQEIADRHGVSAQRISVVCTRANVVHLPIIRRKPSTWARRMASKTDLAPAHPDHREPCADCGWSVTPTMNETFLRRVILCSPCRANRVERIHAPLVAAE